MKDSEKEIPPSSYVKRDHRPGRACDLFFHSLYRKTLPLKVCAGGTVPLTFS